MNFVAPLMKLPVARPAGALIKRSSVLLNSYSEIFFLQSPFAGLILLMVTLINPNVGLAGLISVASAYLFARLIGMQKSFMTSGFFTYNALLAGLSIGYLFRIEPTTVFLISTAGVLTYVMSVALNSVFSLYLKLPILSLPFVMVSSIAWLASQQYSALYIDGLYVHSEVPIIWLPGWIEGFFTALGAILFTPHPLAGLAVAAVLLWHSRILFILAVGGYLLGAGLGAFLGINPSDPFADINHFNYILIAMALGGVFLVPSPRSYLIAAIGVAVSALLLSSVRLFWANYGIPAFTLPFNMVTLGFIYVLGIVGFELVAKRIGQRPEDTLDDFLTTRERFSIEGPELKLPFSGVWTVWQGFDGKWTHTGSWRHAYDFVITEKDAEGNQRTHRGKGKRLEDYYAWEKPVMSPCRGRVIQTIANLPDNPPGHVDSYNNWGNLVVIESTEGWYVEISHFAEASLKVSEGDWVEPGTVLGLCGNSGYSAQPHIHMQLQSSARVGSATIPFQFRGYIENTRFIPSGLPAEQSLIEPLLPDRALEYRMAIPLDTTIRYRLSEGNEDQGLEGEMSVCSNELGETYLAAEQGRLYFAQNDCNFYFYRLEGDHLALRTLYAGLPRLPLSFEHGLNWQDALPLSAVCSQWQRGLLDLARALHPGFVRYKMNARWTREATIEGMITAPRGGHSQKVRVQLDARLGISALQLGNRTLVMEADVNG